jgi:hypothetical protein
MKSGDAYLILFNHALRVTLRFISKSHLLVELQLSLISLLYFANVGGLLLAKNARDHPVVNDVFAAGSA